MELKICIGSACHIKGSTHVISIIQQLIEEYQVMDQVELKAGFCLGHCTEAVSVQLNQENIYSVSETTARDFFKEEVLTRINSKEIK